MPEITSIKPQKNKKRVNIYLDGKFSFGIDLENYIKLGLKTGDHLTDDEVGEIVKKAEFQKTFDKILRFGMLRPRSKKEISDWLKRKKVHESMHKGLFNRLKRMSLINDEEFARWWIKQRIEFRPKGKKALYSELVKKGIDREIIETALSEIELDEIGLASGILKNKAYKWERLKGFDKKKKMSDFLARRGFMWETIKKAIEKIDQKDIKR